MNLEWTVVSDANGNAMLTLTYTKADIGKVFTYVISEINDGRENVWYSDAEYTVTVTVSLDEQTNTLVATYTVNGKTADSIVAEFENVYDYTPAAQTGDMTIGSVVIAVLAMAGLVCVWAFKKRRGLI